MSDNLKTYAVPPKVMSDVLAAIARMKALTEEVKTDYLEFMKRREMLTAEFKNVQERAAKLILETQGAKFDPDALHIIDNTYIEHGQLFLLVQTGDSLAADAATRMLESLTKPAQLN